MPAVRGILRWVLPWLQVPRDDCDYGIWEPTEEPDATGNEYVRPADGKGVIVHGLFRPGGR